MPAMVRSSLVLLTAAALLVADEAAACTPDPCAEVLAFVESGRLPEVVSPGFVAALREALAGVVVVDGEGLRGALAEGGACTLAELCGRLERHVGERLAGRDGARVRVVIE